MPPVREDVRVARAQQRALNQMRRRIAEADFQRQVEDLLTRGRWEFIHLRDARKQKAEGWPDLFAVKGKRIIAAELKTETGTTTDEQERWLALLREAGIETYVWRPRDFDDVTKVLLGVDTRRPAVARDVA